MEREFYKECMRNHAATIGSYATDGCGEYTSADPTDMKLLFCAACGCHRNFHRKVVVEASTAAAMLCYSSPASSMEERGVDGKSCKRSRTKFTTEQKEKMLMFAEKVGWKMPRKEGREDLERFCEEIGIGRQVFKVWMHNHKNTSSSSSSSTFN